MKQEIIMWGYNMNNVKEIQKEMLKKMRQQGQSFGTKMVKNDLKIANNISQFSKGHSTFTIKG